MLPDPGKPGFCSFCWIFEGCFGNGGSQKGCLCGLIMVECVAKTDIGCAIFGGPKICRFSDFIFGRRGARQNIPIGGGEAV
jgi:hypothetical protein